MLSRACISKVVNLLIQIFPQSTAAPLPGSVVMETVREKLHLVNKIELLIGVTEV